MQKIGQPVVRSVIANDLNTALRYASERLSVVVRPAFTLGGSGGGIAQCRESRDSDKWSIPLPIHQILVEKSVAGWKEIEFEVMRTRQAMQ